MRAKAVMKSQTANSQLSHNFTHSRPSQASFAVSESMRQGGRIRFAKVRMVDPYELSPCHPTASEAKLRSVEHVTGLRGSKLAAGLASQEIKRFKVTVKDRITGEPVEVLAKLDMRTVTVVSYGVVFRFSCKAGSRTAVDSRSGKRVELTFVNSELVRILGNVEGEAKFAEFAGVM
jgi:hypothetical protein